MPRINLRIPDSVFVCSSEHHFKNSVLYSSQSHSPSLIIGCTPSDFQEALFPQCLCILSLLLSTCTQPFLTLDMLKFFCFIAAVFENVFFFFIFVIIVPSKLIMKLRGLGLNTGLQHVIGSRTCWQADRRLCRQATTFTLTLSISAPQGIVLGPLLHSDHRRRWDEKRWEERKNMHTFCNVPNCPAHAVNMYNCLS